VLIAHDYRVAGLTAPTALAIGNFDGVHRGHQHLFGRVVAAARALHGRALALTFDPHPTRVLAPDRAAPQLMGLDRRLELMAAAGLDAVVVQRFDTTLSSQPAREFVEHIVLGLQAREVFIGNDFHFGRNREGNGAVLEALGAELGFIAHVLEPVTEGDAPISSTRTRKALADGDLALVETLLGRRFDLDGLVVHGFHRGRTLGFPTANLATPSEALPRDGVYAVRVRVHGDTDRVWHPAVLNLGTRPTLRAGRSIEVHLLGVDRDLYGRTLRVSFVKRLRDERRFDGLDALRAQIARDADEARATLSQEPSDEP
jgi:riboflavin kinase / FMN adenylyltransferase